MSNKQTLNYTFNKTLKTITFAGLSSVALESIHAVVNATRSVVIFNPMVPNLGGTVATNVLTLTYDTSVGMADTDKLIIIYNDGLNEDKVVFTLLNSVTSNQTSNAIKLPRGRRTLQASISGTGAVSATVAFYGNNSNSNSGGVLIATTTTLSGTTSASDGAESPAEWPYLYCALSSIAGTGAAVTVTVAI